MRALKPTRSTPTLATSLSFGSSRVTAGHETLGSAGGEFDGTLHLELLLNLDGVDVELRQMSSGCSTRGTLIPGSQGLEELDADDTHGPLEVLCPGGNNGGQRDGAQANESLGLHVAEERHGVGGNVGSSVGVTQAGGDGRGSETDSSDDGGDPSDSLLLDRVAV
jgi:hypothetical protein